MKTTPVVFFVTLLISLDGDLPLEQFNCSYGQYLNTEHNNTCKPCPYDQFMPRANHSQSQCYQCGHARPHLNEIELKPCTETSNTSIGCTPGHYIETLDNDYNSIRCLLCTKCSETIPVDLPKGERKHNYESAALTNSLDNIQYRQAGRQWCGPGQYLRESNENEDVCEECEDGTYMDKTNHIETQCYNCKIRRLNFDDIMGCVDKKTYPVVIGCEGQNYLRRTFEDDPSTAECLPCTQCQDGMYKIRACTNKTDTLCCPNSDMTSSDDGLHYSKVSTSTTTSSFATTSTTTTPTTTRATIHPINDSGTCTNESTSMISEILLPIILALNIISLIIITVLAFFIWKVHKCCCPGRFCKPSGKNTRDHDQAQDLQEIESFCVNTETQSTDL